MFLLNRLPALPAAAAASEAAEVVFKGRGRGHLAEVAALESYGTITQAYFCPPDTFSQLRCIEILESSTAFNICFRFKANGKRTMMPSFFCCSLSLALSLGELLNVMLDALMGVQHWEG